MARTTLYGKRQAGALTTLTPRTDSGLASRSTASLAAPSSRGCHRQAAHARPSAVLSSAALPQPSTVRGCPIAVDASRPASALNHRIRLAAQWSDVADIVDELGEALAPSNAAYALFRLGCLYSFMSVHRKQALEASGVVQRLLELAQVRIGAFTAADVTFLLDGCTRLGLHLAAPFLDALAAQLEQTAGSLLPAQVPLLFWAFATLAHRPAAGVLAALEAQACQTGSQLTAQGVSLILSSCQALGHQPEGATLACLEAAMRAALPAFKRAELAACLEAFKAWGYCPGSDLLQAIAQRAGVQLSPALRQPAVPSESSAAPAPKPMEAVAAAADLFRSTQNAGGSLAAVVARADAEKKARQVARKAPSSGSRPAGAPLGATIQEWLYEFGRQETPQLCADEISSEPQSSSTGYWRFGGRAAGSPVQLNV